MESLKNAIEAGIWTLLIAIAFAGIGALTIGFCLLAGPFWSLVVSLALFVGWFFFLSLAGVRHGGRTFIR